MEQPIKPEEFTETFAKFFLRKGKSFLLYSQTKINMSQLYTYCNFHLLLTSLMWFPSPTSGLRVAHDPSALLRPLRSHPSPGPHCNPGIDFLYPCPLINHQVLQCISKQAVEGMAYIKPRRSAQTGGGKLV